MKQLKTVEVKENSGGIYTGALGGIYGEAFRFEIKPYLKKLKILDTDKFSFKG